MQWIIPGTTVSGDKDHALAFEQQLSSLFLAGGIALHQVTAITGLEPYMVQNWVKRGFLSAPRQKAYSLNQLCRIMNINMLRRTLSMDKIVGLLRYINGHLDDTSDDIIDDSQLYFMFVRVAAAGGEMQSLEAFNAQISRVMEGYTPPVPDAKERVEKVLRIMLTAWAAAQFHEKAERMVADL